MNSTPPKNSEERSKLWTIFWLTLVGAPALPLVMALVLPRHVVHGNGTFAAAVGWVGAIVGAIVCGCLLAKLTLKTGGPWGNRAVCFSILFLLLFGVFAFAGCAGIIFG